MNISPDSIDKYKQQMLNMYHTTRATSSTTSNMTTARNLAANVPQPTIPAQPANSVQQTGNIPQQTGNTVQPVLPAVPAAEDLPVPVPDEATPSLIEDGIALKAAIEADELNLFDPSLEAEDRAFVPTFITPPPSVPDTGYIEVPDFPGIPDTQPAAPPANTQKPSKPSKPSKPKPPKPKPPKPKPPENPPSAQVPDTQPAKPFPELKDGIGYLRTQAYTGNRAIPVAGALIIITEHIGDEVRLVRILGTDESGYTETVPLPVPEYDPDLYPDPTSRPYRDYRLSAFAEGYYIIKDVPVPIYAGVKSLQPIALVPLRENEDKINYLPKPLDEILTEVGVTDQTEVTVPQEPANPGVPDVGAIAAPTGSVG